jgi:hypothetical protein
MEFVESWRDKFQGDFVYVKEADTTAFPNSSEETL